MPISKEEALWQGITHIRQQAPLVVNVTNNVVTNFTANALLALGASPAMRPCTARRPQPRLPGREACRCTFWTRSTA